MTAAALVAAQIALHAQIEARAVALGYDAAEVARIAPWDWVEAVVATAMSGEPKRH